MLWNERVLFKELSEQQQQHSITLEDRIRRFRMRSMPFESNVHKSCDQEPPGDWTIKRLIDAKYVFIWSCGARN